MDEYCLSRLSLEDGVEAPVFIRREDGILQLRHTAKNKGSGAQDGGTVSVFDDSVRLPIPHGRLPLRSKSCHALIRVGKSSS